ncbi:hypothetical protein C4S75_00150 [Apibacter sp. wkB309]|nr:hypothetical protein C4S75_00150 [Apibacter sp. wkB309]
MNNSESLPKIINKKGRITFYKKFIPLLFQIQGKKSSLEDTGNIFFKYSFKTSYYLRCFFLFLNSNNKNYTIITPIKLIYK